MIPQEDIRNFSIIAHIDHGKSTLSDRLIELCGAVDQREMEPQLLDNMDLERERGITIKARAVGLTYHRGGKTYTLNLIDTPGHVDFNYEVSRSLAACEGAVLIVDASQGVEAQTLANTYLALEHDLEILPVINKIDLPAADPQRTKTEIEDIIGIPAMDAPEISAKQGINIQAVLDDIVDHVPAPKGDPDAPLQALVFDSQYDSYRGVIVLMRIVAGTLRRGMEVTMMSTGASYKVLEVGHLRPIGLDPCEELGCGDVGYFTASIKNVEDTRVGDTVTETARPAAEPLPGYRPARSMVYCGIYTEDGSKYPDLRDALEKLKLNDASLSFEPESSVALGFGFRCGFLGMLHMEIIQERLEREFDLDLITTLPSVIYRITKTDGTVLMIDNPHDYPNPASIEVAEEPFVNVSIITPQEFVGNIMPLCQDLRGEYKNMQYLDSRLVELHYEMPLNEIFYNFFDTLKARTKGYASLDYEFSSYHPSELVKVDMLLNGDQVDALSFIAHKDKAYGRARKLCEKLKENIPRQLFEIPVQAAIGGKIIARETVKA
ncbi:MAG: translation elongation factor 4, partial [Oscillospiraceae bacterium]|nr:translation elongation factor 4 [Oscillospiraceae bacterium]